MLTYYTYYIYLLNDLLTYPTDNTFWDQVGPLKTTSNPVEADGRRQMAEAGGWGRRLRQMAEDWRLKTEDWRLKTEGWILSSSWIKINQCTPHDTRDARILRAREGFQFFIKISLSNQCHGSEVCETYGHVSTMKEWAIGACRGFPQAWC